MFPNIHYVTHATKALIELNTQEYLWQLAADMKVKQDWLQTFKLSVCGGKQKIIHTQETPKHLKRYIVDAINPVETEVFIIDNKGFSLMILKQEIIES